MPRPPRCRGPAPRQWKPRPLTTVVVVGVVAGSVSDQAISTWCGLPALFDAHLFPATLPAHAHTCPPSLGPTS